MDAPGPARRLTGPATIVDVEGRLRTAGLRVTAPRRLVFEALAGLGGHRSAREVGAAVAAIGAHVSRATVYNALDALHAAGAVAVVAAGGPGHTRYEVAGCHHHFVCRHCGRVLDVPADAVPPTVTVPGAVVDEVRFSLTGTCPDCVRSGFADEPRSATVTEPFGGGVIGNTTGSGPVIGGSSPPPRALEK